MTEQQPGGQQPSGQQQPANKTSTGLEQNVAGLLCYVGFWVTGIIFLLIETENKYVRFHAIQSICVFGFLYILYAIFFWVHVFNWIIWAAIFIFWVVLMYKAYQGQMWKVPVAGKFAEQKSQPKVQK
jgi:uncharacterized membrane protein